jgi:hypothetical protein
MAEESGAVHDAALVDAILPLVPACRSAWRRASTSPTSAAGAGTPINLMARAFPNSRFVGYDFSEEGVRAGARRPTAWGLANARFEARDATDLGARERFDLVTAFDAIHDQAQPRARSWPASRKRCGRAACS